MLRLSWALLSMNSDSLITGSDSFRAMEVEHTTQMNFMTTYAIMELSMRPLQLIPLNPMA